MLILVAATWLAVSGCRETGSSAAVHAAAGGEAGAEQSPQKLEQQLERQLDLSLPEDYTGGSGAVAASVEGRRWLPDLFSRADRSDEREERSVSLGGRLLTREGSAEEELLDYASRIDGAQLDITLKTP